MYEKVILNHYAAVAAKEGHLESCTMADDQTRKIETKFIVNSVENIIQEFRRLNVKNRPILLDAGCGNGSD